MLSFKSRFLLNERRNNVANEINSNTKRLLKDFANYLKDNLENSIKDNAERIGLGDLRQTSDNDFIIVGMKLGAEFLLDNGGRTLDLYNKEFDIKIRNRRITIPVTISLSNQENNLIGGGFSVDQNEQNPEIAIYIDALEVDMREGRAALNSIVMKLVKSISHEVMHCYQYLSKNNYIKGSAKESQVPESFSYIVYYLQQNEIEAVLSSAYSIYKQKHKNLTYLQALLLVIDFAISATENEVKSKDITIKHLIDKYTKHKEKANIFMLNYILKIGIKNSRYYSLISRFDEYKKYVATLDNNLKNIKEIIDEIYNIAEEKFESDDYEMPAIYWLLRKRSTIYKMVSSEEGARQILEQVKTGKIKIMAEEEEDEIIYGRPESWD